MLSGGYMGGLHRAPRAGRASGLLLLPDALRTVLIILIAPEWQATPMETLEGDVMHVVLGQPRSEPFSPFL
jgi:hypothetical protein